MTGNGQLEELNQWRKKEALYGTAEYGAGLSHAMPLQRLTPHTTLDQVRGQSHRAEAEDAAFSFAVYQKGHAYAR